VVFSWGGVAFSGGVGVVFSWGGVAFSGGVNVVFSRGGVVFSSVGVVFTGFAGTGDLTLSDLTGGAGLLGLGGMGAVSFLGAAGGFSFDAFPSSPCSDLLEERSFLLISAEEVTV
jgi:hypothetical protein